jgi:hypothetical protein
VFYVYVRFYLYVRFYVYVRSTFVFYVYVRFYLYVRFYVYVVSYVYINDDFHNNNMGGEKQGLGECLKLLGAEQGEL